MKTEWITKNVSLSALFWEARNWGRGHFETTEGRNRPPLEIVTT
jgi:hypothetical protein